LVLKLNSAGPTTHSSEFKAQVVAACSHPGISIAAVAMANGINANLARRWVIEAERCASGSTRLPARASGVAQTPSFVAVQLPLSQPTPDIRIELRRGATAITVHWPTGVRHQILFFAHFGGWRPYESST
jgi:transposase